MSILLPDGRKEYLSELGDAVKKIEGELISNRTHSPYNVIRVSVEKSMIEAALERTFGNQAKASKILGINRNTLRSKISKLGIDTKKWKL